LTTEAHCGRLRVTTFLKFKIEKCGKLRTQIRNQQRLEKHIRQGDGLEDEKQANYHW